MRTWIRPAEYSVTLHDSVSPDSLGFAKQPRFELAENYVFLRNVESARYVHLEMRAVSELCFRLREESSDNSIHVKHQEV